MKYIIILADGMADYNIAELGNQSPLQYANTPHIDLLAHKSIIGKVATIPAGFPPGSDVANLSVLGYDPQVCYTGRSPLEAVSLGIQLEDNDLALRCNLVTLSDAPSYSSKTMIDYSSGEINTSESRELITEISSQLGNETFIFHPGISYRHLLVWKNGAGKDLSLTPPHDITDKGIGGYLPGGKDAPLLLDLMQSSTEILINHPVNLSRKARGLNPATSIWLWGEGRKPALPSMTAKYKLNGSVVAAVDLVRGLGICAGLIPVKVEGATGGVETNFAGKARAALDELKRGQDFVYVHIESPDEAGHQGHLQTKIWSIEQIDRDIIGLICDEMDSFPEFRLMLLPDHPTPVSMKTHSNEPVPFMIFDKNRPNLEGPGIYNEATASRGIFIDSGCQLMDFFITGQK